MSLPHLHQLVHQRLRRTMDAFGRLLEDEARPRTNLDVVRDAACDYGSEGCSSTVETGCA